MTERQTLIILKHTAHQLSMKSNRAAFNAEERFTKLSSDAHAEMVALVNEISQLLDTLREIR